MIRMCRLLRQECVYRGRRMENLFRLEYICRNLSTQTLKCTVDVYPLSREEIQSDTTVSSLPRSGRGRGPGPFFLDCSLFRISSFTCGCVFFRWV